MRTSTYRLLPDSEEQEVEQQVSQRPSIVQRFASSGFTLRIIVVGLALSAIGSLSTITFSRHTSLLCDPHTLPGHLYGTDDPADSLWLPDDSAKAQSCPTHSLVKSLLGTNTTSPLIPSGHLSIFILGNSVDRNNVAAACALLKGRLTIVSSGHVLFPIKDLYDIAPYGWQPGEPVHIDQGWPRVCQISRVLPGGDFFNISLANLHTWGLDTDGYWQPFHSYWPPYKVEDRVRMVGKPILEALNISLPTFIEIAADYWDLQRIGIRDDELANRLVSSGTKIEELPSRQSRFVKPLQEFTLRFSEVLQYMHKVAFPTLPLNRIYIRSVHAGKDERDGWIIESPQSVKGFHFPEERVNAINAAHKEGMRKAGLWRNEKEIDNQIDKWGHMLNQEKNFQKAGDIHPDGRAVTLWLEMWLYRWHKLHFH